MPIPELHETFLADLSYRIKEANKNASMHAATAATLSSLKDLYERRIDEYKHLKANEAKRASTDSGVSEHE
jgi:hypothetical protein